MKIVGSITITDETFEFPNGFDLKEFFHRWIDRTRFTTPEFRTRLAISPSVFKLLEKDQILVRSTGAAETGAGGGL